MKIKVALFGIILVVSGCISTPQYEYPYDPSEEIILGVVKSKKTIRDPEKYIKAERDAAARRNQMIFSQTQAIDVGPVETIGAIIILNMLGVDPPGGVAIQGEPTAYTVIAQGNIEYKVVSYFPGFEEGQCVKLFISKNSQKYPPRLAHGSGCSGA